MIAIVKTANDEKLKMMIAYALRKLNQGDTKEAIETLEDALEADFKE